MNAQATPPNPPSRDDDMPAEIDFSKGVRGKFFSPNLRLRIPIYLDDETQRYLIDRAQAKGTDVTALVNQLLKKDIELIEAAR
jgi:hypothetical protein